jgi:hypothetical protein
MIVRSQLTVTPCLSIGRCASRRGTVLNCWEQDHRKSDDPVLYNRMPSNECKSTARRTRDLLRESQVLRDIAMRITESAGGPWKL